MTNALNTLLTRQAAARRVQSLIGDLERACREAGWDFRKVAEVPIHTPGKTAECHIAIRAPS